MQKRGSVNLELYLNESSSARRVEILRELVKQGENFDLDMVRDLLELDLSSVEKTALISIAHGESAELEDFLLKYIGHQDQDIAVEALAVWVKRTEHQKFAEVAALASVPEAPQRLLYRLTDAAYFLGGYEFMERIAVLPNLQQLSNAFLGLVLQQATRLNCRLSQFDDLAKFVLHEVSERREGLLDKTVPGAMAYAMRFFDADAFSAAKRQVSAAWDGVFASVLNNRQLFGTPWIEQSLANDKLGDFKSFATLGRERLPFWFHHRLPLNMVAPVLESVDASLSLSELFAALGAIDEGVLIEVMKTTGNAHAAVACATLLMAKNVPASRGVSLQVISERLKENKEWQEVFAERLPAPYAAAVGEIRGTSAANKRTGQTVSDRSRCFDVIFRGERSDGVLEKISDPYFKALVDAFTNPRDELLEPLAVLGRQTASVWQLCFLHVLARFKNSDKAVLKLLDYIRSGEEAQLRYLVKALCGIGNSRAAMELISALTRPNISNGLQLEISYSLRNFDLSQLQGELHSAIKDLPVKIVSSEFVQEIKENLESLLIKRQDKVMPLVATEQQGDLDTWLGENIGRYDDLSGEAKRALRTARLFQVRLVGDSEEQSIDLSPVIDMQYKCLELTFRELFEDACTQVIESQGIPRKLDVLGYARPIEQKMSDFENYIAGLPVVNTIPFFSKFKLRKMLRAICQFRPGKRFTLDGVKAFGLFFLCFGRKRDVNGLAGVFPTPFADDLELFNLCKQLHQFQDWRNRAAHEGFHPDAANDLAAIWRETASIITNAFAMRDHLCHVGRSKATVSAPSASAATTGRSRSNSSAPPVQIVYKKSS